MPSAFSFFRFQNLHTFAATGSRIFLSLSSLILYVLSIVLVLEIRLRVYDKSFEFLFVFPFRLLRDTSSGKQINKR